MKNRITLLIYKIINGHYMFFFKFFRINKNKIVIVNYYGKGYGDNGKAIVDNLLQKNKGYDIVWLVNKEIYRTCKFPKDVRVVKYKTFKALYELATAKVWVDNCRKFFRPPKRKKQIYIQTWHGGIALKKVENDARNALSHRYITIANQDSKITDVFISNSKFCTSMYKKAFNFNGEILEYGTPRCDILFNGSKSSENLVDNGISIEKKTLLYAPTFRNSKELKYYDVDFKRVLKTLKEKFNNDWQILIRLHPNISSEKINIECENVIDVTSYGDMYELMSISDVLLTDYSSTMFEFALTNKIVLLYANDLEEYKKERDFYFELDKLPFHLSKDNEDLINAIINFDIAKYQEDLKTFYKTLGSVENGLATEKVCQFIESNLKKVGR